MFRIALMAAAVTLFGAAAAAQGPVDVNGASRGGRSTGPTFPTPGPEILTATAPIPAGGEAEPNGQPASEAPGINSDTSIIPAATPSPSPRLTR